MNRDMVTRQVTGIPAHALHVKTLNSIAQFPAGWLKEIYVWFTEDWELKILYVQFQPEENNFAIYDVSKCLSSRQRHEILLACAELVAA